MLPHERETPQPLRIDLDIVVDMDDVAESDVLTDTVDYGAVAIAVAELVRSTSDQLLERLAGRIAAEVVAFPKVDAVSVTVTKMRPPIPEIMSATSVTLHREATRSKQGDDTVASMHRAIVALGSNLGDRERFLRFALDELGGVIAESQVFETDPIGGPGGQGAFLNMVAEVETDLDPYAFLRRLHRIEAAANRQREVHWGPRTLDLDLLFYDDVTISDPTLTVPHPHLGLRRFVLTPLAEIAPQRCPPGWDETLEPSGVHPRGALAR